MLRNNILIVAAFALAACGQVKPPEAAAPAAPTSFVINDLTETDGQIQGCTRGLSRVGAQAGAGEIFREDAVGEGAKGFIRIDGALLNVGLVSANEDEKGGVRIFEDAAHTVHIVETLTTGAAHEEADSVEEAGTLVITRNGITQTLQVAGGTAC